MNVKFTTQPAFNISRRSVLAGIAATSTILLTGGPASAQESTLEKAKASGKLRVGIANEKPYGYIDTDGSMKGAVPDLIRAIIEPLGIKDLEAQVADFNALIPGLNAGRFDIIGAGMYVTPPRCEAIAFTNPFTQTGGGLLARKGESLKIASLEDLAGQSAIKVGTQSGTSQIQELSKAGVPKDRVVLFARVDEAVAGLQANRCDVIYFPSLQVNELMNMYKDQGVEQVEGFTTPLNYQAFGVRKADTDLVAALNAGIATAINDGTLLKIVQGYGYGEREIPESSKTSESICAG
ncbi:ectoine/hydroxyectoine ABC transporter substrate-binding protein EhuB [Mesorhizobium sp. A623]